MIYGTFTQQPENIQIFRININLKLTHQGLYGKKPKKVCSGQKKTQSDNPNSNLVIFHGENRSARR
jgi:hypothetical protein